MRRSSPTEALRRFLGPALLGLAGGWMVSAHAKYTIAAIAALAGAFLMFFGAEYLLFGVVAADPWENYLAFPSATLTVPKLVGFLAVAAWLLAAMSGRLKLRYTPQIGISVAFVCAILVSLIGSTDISTGTAKTISFALYATILVLLVQQLTSFARLERCLMVYALAAAAAAADGLYGFLSGSQPRAAGPISDPNDFAFLLASALPFAVYFLRTRRHQRPLWIIAIVMLAGCMLATLSRGALVGLIVVLVWGVATRRISVLGVLASTFAVIALAGIAVLFYKPLIHETLAQKSSIANKNVNSREVFWQAAYHMFLDHPVLGVGPNMFPYESQFYLRNDPIQLQNPIVHNSYLEILAENGPFALALFIGLLASTWRSLVTARRVALRRGDIRGRQLSDAMHTSLVWVIVSGAFVSRELAIPFWLLGGAAGALSLLQRPMQLQTEAPLHPDLPPPASAASLVRT